MEVTQAESLRGGGSSPPEHFAKIEKVCLEGGNYCAQGGENRSGEGEFSRAQAQIILPSWPILVLRLCLQPFKAPVKNVKILKNSGDPRPENCG